MSTHALLAINNLGVVEAFFKGIREVLDGSGHTDGMGVDGDHVGIVDVVLRVEMQTLPA